ncbi:MAG TPA: hypothetical protein VF720_03910 [Candidatus Eisenbacteria bacterium]
MRSRSKWVVVLGVTALLTASQASFDGLGPWANETPGSEGEVSLGDRRPVPDGSGNGSGGGQTEGIRQGADPNDFSVSSPRRPNVSTSATPERRDLGSQLRIWFQAMLNRFGGLVHRN